MLEIWRSQKLLYGFEGYFIRIVLEFRWFLRHFETKYLPFFICLHQIITTMKLISHQRFAIFAPQTFRISLFSLLRVHNPNHLLPLGNGIPLTALSIDQYHNRTFSTHHVLQNIFEIWFVFMFVEEIDDLLLEQLSLDHVFNYQLTSLLDQINYLLQPLGLQYCVWLYYSQSERQVDLFGIEKSLLHSKLYFKILTRTFTTIITTLVNRYTIGFSFRGSGCLRQFYLINLQQMNPYRYQEIDQEDPQQGFQTTPTISEVVIQPPSANSFWASPSTAVSHHNLKHRHSSNQKPSFKLKPLERHKQLKGSNTTIKKRPIQIRQYQGSEGGTSDNQRIPTLKTQKTKEHLSKNSSLTTIQSIMDAVVIKNRRTQIAQNITISTGRNQQDQMINQQLLKHPSNRVVYRQHKFDSTYSHFRHLLKNANGPNFMQNKYNLALRNKMKRQNKEEQQRVIDNSQPLSECIQFRGDFQSGNLDFVTKVDQDQYNVHLRVDTNTRGHRSWFYFKVCNHFKQHKRLTINICNIAKRFKMIERGQKVYVKSNSYQASWRLLDQNVQIQSFGKKKFKLSFQLPLKQKQQLFVSLIPVYTYSDLLSDIQIYEQSPNARVNILTHSITGLAIPLITISKGASKQRKNRAITKKRVLLVSGRIHPSQTCSSYILKSLIRELLSQTPQYEDLLTHNIIKIIPMLNPDGVVFGNFRTNYLGDDLNRCFSKNDETIYPEIHAIKELGKYLKNDYGDNFIGFLDMHGHSSQINSFIYGPQHQENSDQFVECRILPKILDNISKYFRYEMSSFRLQEYKFNTARGFFFKKLKVPAYTIQTSYALYLDKINSEEGLKEMSVVQWQDYGVQMASVLLSYFKYLQAKNNLIVFRTQKEKKLVKQESLVDFNLLKKQIERDQKTHKQKDQQLKSEESDGQSEEEDLPEMQKYMIIKRYKETTTPNFLLPKVPKASMPLPSVIPSMIGGRKEERMSGMPKLVNKYRQKKMVRPLNMSYEYTQYLLKNICQVGGLKPQIINFGCLSHKKQTSPKKKNRSTLSEL